MPNLPSQTKIGNLNNVAIADQNITCCQISVDVVLGLQIGHASGYLGSHIDERLHFDTTTFACNSYNMLQTNTKEKLIMKHD